MAERRAVKVWLPGEEFELVDGLAGRAGVETGALCREAIMRGAAQVAADAVGGRVRLRRRSGASSEASKSEPVRSVRVASTAVVEDLGSGDAPVEVAVPGRDVVRRWAMERQRRLNEAKERS